MNRRGFLGSILAAGMAPAIVKASSLMPVRPLGSLILPGDYAYSLTLDDSAIWQSADGFTWRLVGYDADRHLREVARSMREDKERIAFEVLRRIL